MKIAELTLVLKLLVKVRIRRTSKYYEPTGISGSEE
jgi:hypothetical protein